MSNCGIGFTGILAIVFIVLKLTNNIDWSWWWVLSPLWIGTAFGLLILVLWISFLAFGNYRCGKRRVK